MGGQQSKWQPVDHSFWACEICQKPPLAPWLVETRTTDQGAEPALYLKRPSFSSSQELVWCVSPAWEPLTYTSILDLLLHMEVIESYLGVGVCGKKERNVFAVESVQRHYHEQISARLDIKGNSS